MVKTLSNNVTSSSADETKKQRKKQAKREAKTMLAVEQAKQDVQKAEQKAAKSQARLEAHVAHLRTLEAKLAKIRTSPQESEPSMSGGGVDGHQEQPEAAQEAASTSNAASQPYLMTEGNEASTGASAASSWVNVPPPTDQEVSLPPAEGRKDIPQDQGTASSEWDNPRPESHAENGTTSAEDTEDDGSDSEEMYEQEGTRRSAWSPRRHSQPHTTEEESETQSEEGTSQDVDSGATDY